MPGARLDMCIDGLFIRFVNFVFLWGLVSTEVGFLASFEQHEVYCYLFVVSHLHTVFNGAEMEWANLIVRTLQMSRFVQIGVDLSELAFYSICEICVGHISYITSV